MPTRAVVGPLGRASHLAGQQDGAAKRRVAALMGDARSDREVLAEPTAV